MFLRGVANTFDDATRVRPIAAVGQVDYKTSGCLDGLVINGNPISGCGEPATTRCRSARPAASTPGSPAALQYQYSRNKGTTQGSNEAVTASNTFDYDTEFGTNPTDIPHTFNGSLIYMPPVQRPVGRRLARRRHRERAQRRADQRHHQPPGHGDRSAA